MTIEELNKNKNDLQLWAEKLNYKKFTNLQDMAFSNPETYNFFRWLFIVGATSSGKTLIPILIYIFTYYAYKNKGEKCKLLFAVPYRALAAQKTSEIKEILEKLKIELEVVQSTGEFKEDDARIINGGIDIAVLIYEKIYLFSSMNSRFFEYYDFLIMDEIGLIGDSERGIKIDFILAKAKQLKNLKVIALGTPFYNWDNYIKKYDFLEIKDENRPVELEVNPIFYTKNGINYVGEKCKAVSRKMFKEIKNDRYALNPIQRIDQIIEDICEYHLRKGHKILIIENNREEVKKLSHRLYKSMVERKILCEKIEKCREYIQKKGKIQQIDELYGVMETEDYSAFSYGVSYHNADMPVMLRGVIEEEFLSKKGILKIVCSTETLVYGINSATDVVIIPHMTKQRVEEDKTNNFLYANEYMNYIGRAGRLEGGESPDTIDKKGYVYPFIKAVYNLDDNLRKNPDKDQKILWEKLQKEIKNPNKISSEFFKLEANYKPFYLLNLFPNNRDMPNETITKEQLDDIFEVIPKSEENEQNLYDDVEIMLQELMKRKLVYRMGNGKVCSFTQYYLSDYGRALLGYVISLDDFDYLTEKVDDYIMGNRISEIDILYKVLNCVYMKKYTAQNILFVNKDYIHLIKNISKEIISMYERYQNEISKELRGKLKRSVINLRTYLKNKQYDKISTNSEYNILRQIAALLIWKEEKSPVKSIYDRLGINYAQMTRFSEQASYYIDILRFALPVSNYNQGDLFKNQGHTIVDEMQKQMKMLSDGIYYRVSPQILQMLDIQCNDPYMASKIREATKIYEEINKIRKKGVYREKEKETINKMKAIMSTWDDAWKVVFYDEFKGVLDYGHI